MQSPIVKAIFDPETWTVSYVASDPSSRDAIIIDPVLDYDALASQTSTASAEKIIAYIREEGLTVRAILETHAHADHISAARFLASKFKVPIGIGADISIVQGTFARVFGLEGSVKVDGSQFDLLLRGGEEYSFGTLKLVALKTPGHTPACLSFLVGDAVFTGDALFMDDYGTGRTDFPAGSADALYHSVHEVLYGLPEATRVFVGHDYQPGGREVRYQSTIGKEKAENVQLREETSREEFVRFRTERDKKLRPPRLIFQSIQVNVFGGHLPIEEDNGVRYLKVPLNLRCATDSSGNEKDPSCRAAAQAAE